MLDVALLGTGGMMPLPERFLTAMLLRFEGRMILLDCGEGTQVTLKSLGWGFKNIDLICFTHMHGDHVAGLPGLLLTIGNSSRTEPLEIIGPVGTKKVVESLLVIAQELPFQVIITEICDGFFHNFFGVNVSVFPLNHRIKCFAYRFDINRIGKFNLEKAETLGIEKKYWGRLQKGETVVVDGETYTPEMVLGGLRKGLSVAYCTDTRPVFGLSEFVSLVDLFICEGLYGDFEKIDKVTAHKHMVFAEAATIAKDGRVSEMWLTHFSPALVSPSYYIKNATDIFKNSKVGFDRKRATLLFEESD